MIKYVLGLNEEMKQQIKKELLVAFEQLGIDDIDEQMQITMSCKAYDLEELIDIKKYIH